MRSLLPRLLDPLGLVVLGAGTVTAALSGELWLAPLAVAGWALIAWGKQPDAPPAPVPVAAPATAGPLAETEARLGRLAQRIAKAVADASPVVRACVEDLPAQAGTLVAQCRALLGRQAALDLFLAESETDDPRRELERARAAEAEARDPGVRERWVQARVAAEARVAEFEQIRTNRARMVAEIAEVEARLKQVLSRIVALDSRDEERLTGLSGELRGSLGDLTRQIAVFDRVLPADKPAAAPEENGARPTGLTQ